MRSIVQADGKVLPNNGGINVCCTLQLQAFICQSLFATDHCRSPLSPYCGRVSLRIIPI
jgi:hypothetical protein